MEALDRGVRPVLIEVGKLGTAGPTCSDLIQPFKQFGRKGSICATRSRKEHVSISSARTTLSFFVQGPVPNRNVLDEMAVDSQKAIGRSKTRSGHEWIELGYAVDGDRFSQRHYVCAVSGSRAFVVTAQCLQAHAEPIFRSTSELTESLPELAA